MPPPAIARNACSASTSATITPGSEARRWHDRGGPRSTPTRAPRLERRRRALRATTRWSGSTVPSATCPVRDNSVAGSASGLAAQSTMKVSGGGSSSVLSSASAACSVSRSARASTATRIRRRRSAATSRPGGLPGPGDREPGRTRAMPMRSASESPARGPDGRAARRASSRLRGSIGELEGGGRLRPPRTGPVSSRHGPAPSTWAL